MNVASVMLSRGSATARQKVLVPLPISGKSRMVADPKNRGFFVVKTDKIIPGDASSNLILVAQTQAEFQRAVSDELGQQMILAMRADQGVKRNEDAITAAKKRITGSGQ